MMRMIVGFDPSKAQPAIGELRQGLGPGVEWRVLNLDQNPNGVEPTRSQADEEHQEQEGNLLQRLADWLGGDKDSAPEQVQQPVGSMATGGGSALELSEEELTYLRRAPARAGTVILITAPESEASTVRLWSMRHGGFSLSPAPTPDTETEIKES
jgi:hypothetical protein